MRKTDVGIYHRAIDLNYLFSSRLMVKKTMAKMVEEVFKEIDKQNYLMKGYDLMKINLSNHEKLIILYTKGHFHKYENALNVILGDYYALPVDLVTDVTRLDAMKRVFSKLLNHGFINTGTLSTSRYLIDLFTSSRSPYDVMYADIQWVNVQNGLKEALDDTDRSIERKMKLKQDITVA